MSSSRRLGLARLLGEREQLVGGVPMAETTTTIVPSRRVRAKRLATFRMRHIGHARAAVSSGLTIGIPTFYHEATKDLEGAFVVTSGRTGGTAAGRDRRRRP